MKNLNIFPKIFIQTFSVMGVIVLLIHLLVFLLFPQTYLNARKEDIARKADDIAYSLNGQARGDIEQTLALYSSTGEVQASVKDESNPYEIQIKENKDINLASHHNSLIIEEREVTLGDGQTIHLQFISTADMQQDAKALSLQFLPYSLSVSLLLSALVSFVYAKSIKNNVQEIKNVTDKMMELDEQVRLEVSSTDEIGQLKAQINDLYTTLLQAIEDVEWKNQEIIRLEKLKYDFFKGASHELKTPLASLKIILENMKYRIGKYQDRDTYINQCIILVDQLTKNISQILSVYSIENLKDDEELLVVNDVWQGVWETYEVLAQQKNIRIHSELGEETMYIGKTALTIILSNLMSNAVKYTEENGLIEVGTDGGWFFMRNSYGDDEELDMARLFDVNFELNKENSHGLGLYIVSALLNNYRIRYEALRREGFFIFRIALSASPDHQLDGGKTKEELCIF